MCGIITIASPPFIGFSGSLRPVPTSAVDPGTPILEQIDFEEFYSAYLDQGRYDAWRSFASNLAESSGTAAAQEVSAASRSNRRERDLRWRIERDLLSLVDAVSGLLDDPKRQLPAQGVRMGWLVELALRALSRLEVRGRDSAGLTLLAWPGSGRRQIISTDEVERGGQPVLPHTLVRLTCDPSGGLALTYKVAEEVGALGYNDGVLRKLIGGDPAFRKIAAAEPGCLLVVGHTRWASTGEISTANAHPVDGSIALKVGRAPTAALVPADRTLAVVNGDVDNYQAIVRELFDGSAFELPPRVTTDSKIVPVLVELSPCDDIEDKLREATSRIQGSLTCVLVRLDAPGRFWSFTKGSGQSLYAGVAGDTCILASEVYGCLELVRNYFPFAGGTAVGQGHAMVCRVRFAAPLPQFTDISTVSTAILEPRYKLAEITTRDVDRRGYRHYFRKELEEAIESVTQTIVGRYSRTPSSSEHAEARFSALYTGDVEEFVQKIKSSTIRRFVFIGQGSAHVAGLAGAHFINEHGSPAGIRADAVTAGEFSAHWMRGDLSTTCIVAVSQSGTTTDTNRAAKLARARGATVLGIVNRRDSTLAEISNLVIYTSDGRDVEMAVASTKAFYSQVVACFLLAQHCGLTAGALIPEQVCAALAEVERLPAAMRACFRREEGIRELARSTAIRRRHWSVLGSGTSRIAAQEIRIKMSELCYKTASVDYLEDKKHIDLSAEPLIVVPVFDLRDDLVEDVAKEVAIFCAHNAAPVVFCDRGSERYRELTPNVIQVPPVGFSLGVVTSALVGHLFAYHTAMAIEEVAERLRALRRRLVLAGTDSSVPGGDPRMRTDASQVRDLQMELATGRLDAVWPAGVASRLSTALAWLAGDYRDESLTALPTSGLGDGAGSAATPLQWALTVIDATIGDTTRPIDSVRHQAKTVTVGTTRAGYSETSATAQALRSMGIALDDVPIRVQHLLGLLDEIVGTVPGGVRYRIEGTAGLVTDMERLSLRVVNKIGCSADRASRFDEGAPVSGTKAIAVHRRQPMLVLGIRDKVPIFVFPLLQNGRPVELVLLHLQFEKHARADVHEGLLAALPDRREMLQTTLEEAKGRPVTTAEICLLPLEVLLFGAADDAIRSGVEELLK